MTLSFKHAFTSAKTDGTDASLLRPSNWNAEHAITLATNKLIGRATAGTGAAEEIPVSAATIALLASADIAAILTYLGVSPFTTGDGKITFKTTADTGWVMMNDGTIGDASSGASRANVDTLALFTLLYNNVLDADAPVLTSAGAATTRATQGTAAVAWAAHVRMSLPKQLGRAIVGAGAGSGLTARALGSNFGGDTTTLLTANLPPIPYTPAGTIAGTTAVPYQGLNVTAGPNNTYEPGGASGTNNLPFVGTFTGTPAALGGTSASLSIAQASAAWNVMVKL